MENNLLNIIEFDFNYDIIAGLNSETKCLYILNYFKKMNKSIVIVENTLYEASHLFQSLNNYSDDILFFPMDDFLTSEALAISPELKMTRIQTIYEILSGTKKIVVTNLMGYLRYLPSPQKFKESFIKLKTNEQYEIHDLIEKLLLCGYQKETIVNRSGEMASRGYVVDIFPISTKDPLRIEFWGDTIDSIRTFDIDTQLTIDNIDEVIIVPNTEFLTDKEVEFENRIHRNLKKYGEVTNITNYFNDCLVIYDDYNQIETSYNLLLDEMMNYSLSIGLSADTTYMNSLYKINNKNIKYFSSFDNSLNKNIINYNCREVSNFEGNFEDINKRLNQHLKDFDIVIICLSDRYKANKIIDDLNNENIIFTDINNLKNKKINLIITNITEGFIYKNIIVISEKEIFNKKSDYSRYKSNFKMGTKIRDITKLDVGDYVVHSINGIGRYLGIQTLLKNGLKKDYLTVEYQDGDKLYIPVEKIDLISKYSSGDGIVPKINKLGGTEWAKTKLKVKSKVADIASDLLRLYAEREKSVGFAFSEDDENQIQFEKEFPYNETLDQLRVVEEIKGDMQKKQPMDRLLCGDVGYGKTEVAFRAMFKAVLNNKQVALLCPTTILSQQHYQNAVSRFKSFPVNIVLLNRFVPYSKLKQNIVDIKEGKADVVIGTHKLLGNDICFKDLGLLVIDEEQRFGVTHKEKIKKYKNNVDVLTLSATPIPRTLQLSMAGLRSLSLIETPPSNRYPVQTYVLAENDQIIKDAIYKELSRGGQVFILYNHIDNMDEKLYQLQRLVPDGRFICGHGRMEKDELENIMMSFINKEYDVLLCTTIIETGIDIPNANTLIIMDADRFGLSQLYQIRGRVGRSNKIAYCYLMYDNSKILNEVATKRLKVIKDFTELGSGFSIAMRDLSIRGAGNILGSEQSGFVDSVGIELFMKMLNEEVDRLKGNVPKTQTNETNVQPLIEIETAINDDYVNDIDLKIEIHKKINEIDSYDKLVSVKEELEDRFGKIPDSLIIYMHEEWFEKLAKSFKIKDILQTKNFIEIKLPIDLTNKIDGEKLFLGLTRLSRMFRLSLKYNQLVIILDIVKLDKHFIYYLIDMIDIINKSIVEKEFE